MKNKLDAILTQLGFIYLVLPFLVFSAGWLNIYASLGFTFCTFLSLVLVLRNVKNDITTSQLLLKNKRQIYFCLIFIIFVVFFSGIGSYTFQNTDHLYRNAIFRDLVTYDWPVIYHVKGFGNHALEGKTTMMTYYLGYFLPSAAVGKIFGFKAAQFALFVWTIFGVILVAYQMGKYLKRFNFKVLLLLFGWGSLFFIGALYKYPFGDFINEKGYLWAGMRLYADSNLGLVYWTFNQSVTAWLVILIIINNISAKNIVFIYSLCFFLSPFAFVGLFPFVVYFMLKSLEGSFLNIKDWVEHVKKFLSFQNILGAGSVVGLNYFYLATNQAGKFFQFIAFPSVKIFVVFMLLSWVFIALLIYPKYKKEPLYWIVIGVLTPLPFFQQGFGIDFPGRVSVPALFILMLLVGKYLTENQLGFNRKVVLGYLAISAFAHFSIETGKSILVTSFENISHHTDLDQILMQNNNESLQTLGKKLKATKHKNICIQDFGTVLNPKNEVIWNYMADIENSKFYKYFAKR
jgi:hypothetical protein